MVRIISGFAGGINLEVPEGIEVRPTLDKIKGAIFSALGSCKDAKVLDLFSGSGNLGLEALSRGAKEVVLIEQVPQFVGMINQNLEKIKKSGQAVNISCNVRVICGNGLDAYKSCSKKDYYDLILADPPYNPKEGQAGPADVMTNQNLYDFVANDAILILESGIEFWINLPENIKWKLLKKKAYGITIVSFWQKISE